MDIKKQQILEAALNLFIEKGYPKTSMQDIAAGCNISKATLYKFFDSKEEIGILAAFYLTEQIKEKTEKIIKQENLPSREMFRAGIHVRMERVSERNRFIDELILSLTPEQMKNCLPAINRNRLQLFTLFSKMIMKSFELQDDSLAAELTINFNGLMREFSIVIRDAIVELDEEAMAEFIIDSLEAILEKRRGKKRLFTKQQLRELRDAAENGEKQLRPLFQKKRLVQDLRAALNEYEKNDNPGKLQEVEHLLTELRELEEGEEE